MVVNKLAFATLLVCLSNLSLAQANECKHRILLLPQTHASMIRGTLEVTPQWFEKTAQSQFTIAQYLLKHKNLPIFSEQISSDKSMQTVSDDFKRIIPPIVKTLFPSGLPLKFTELSEKQKDILSKAGGDVISMVLGATPVLHRAVENDQIDDELFGKITTWIQQNPYATEYPPEIYNLIFSTRENMALDQVNHYFSSHPSQKDVALIFGFEHEMSLHLHAGKFPPECIVTPAEFQSVNSSPYQAAPAFTNSYQSEFGNSNVVK